MNSVFFICKKYIFTLSNKSAVNIISILSAIAIIIATISLFVVLSVFSGLKDLSLSLTNQSDPDLKIFPKIGKTIIVDKNLLNSLKFDLVEDFTFIIEEKALLRYKGKDVIVELKGVSDNFLRINDYETSLQLGKWFSKNSSGIVLGSGVAQKLTLALNDQNNPLEVILPKVGKISEMRIDQAFLSEYLIGVGIFFNTEEANAKYAFIDIELARQLVGLKNNQISSIALKIKPHINHEDAKERLDKNLNYKFNINTRSELNSSLHRMLNTENLVLYLIFVLIIIMVMFTLFGTLLMTIIEKKQNLKTLESLGMTLTNIKSIFVLQGTLVSVLGGLIGLFIGVLMIYFQKKYEIVAINETLAYPVEFKWANVFVVLTTVFSLGIFMSWLATISLNRKFLKE